MKKWNKEIGDIPISHQIVRVNRAPKAKDTLDGYVVAKSKRFVLIHAIDPNFINLNGYSLLRNKDIRRWRLLHDDEFFLSRAFQLKGIEPIPQPDVDLSSFPAALSSANRCFPLITIHQENLDDSVCFIGRVQKLTRKAVILEEISPSAKWEGERRYKYRDITRVDFGGGYEEALALVAESDRVKAYERNGLSSGFLR